MFQQSNLARNIKTYRRLRGLTQGELARRLYVTAQNVSKWETGKSVPDIGNLCKLAEVFSVTPDTLLGGSEEAAAERVLAAIDGGGTKTEFVLFTESGKLLTRLVLGASNPNTVGMEASQALLKRGIDRLLSVSANICALYAGIAGCGVDAVQRPVQSFLKKTYPMIQIKVASDVPNVIYGAPVEDRCIAVICGTGSVVFAKTPEAMHRVGGWGWLWESGCSGYDFGRDAIQAALADRDGIGPKTCLRDIVQTRLGGDVLEKLGDIYRLGQDGIAAFSFAVFEALEREDPVAAAILDKNADLLAKQINTAARRYDCGQDVVLAGGLTSRRAVLEKYLLPRLEPGLRLQFHEKPQICGAAVGSCRIRGKESPDFKETFYKNYLQILEETDHAENRNA